ncbi:MAG TPA: universal stress protein [Opitutaceae bacterium]|nr:universal stress protein [Opitutaceae bacterium]
MKTILTPVDFSAVTESVIAAAATLAKSQGARVALLNVSQPPIITSEYAPYLENISEIAAVSEKASAKQLSRLAMKLQEAGVPTDTVQLSGTPVIEILKQADALQADYIVLGSHGHTAFYDLLVGSTTHGVLLRARCPVLIVPATKRPKA